MPGRFDKSMTLDSDWATDFCATRGLSEAEQGLWAGGAIYNNTSDQALPLSLARTHGAQDLDTLEGLHATTPSLTGERLVDFLDDQLRHAALGELHGQPGPGEDQPDRTASDRQRQVGPPVALHHQGWHPTTAHLMDMLADAVRATILRRRR